MSEWYWQTVEEGIKRLSEVGMPEQKIRQRTVLCGVLPEDTPFTQGHQAIAERKTNMTRVCRPEMEVREAATELAR